MHIHFVSKAFRAVWNLRKTLPLTVRLLIDTRVARWHKMVFLFTTLGYLIFPYDFIFDLPFMGQFDDLAVMVFMVNWFIKHTPKAILEEYGWKEEPTGTDEPVKKKEGRIRTGIAKKVSGLKK